MKRVIALLALAAFVMIAVPVYAGGEKCTQDAQACINGFMAKSKDYGWAGLMYDKAADGSKVVKSVAAGSPAEKAGFQTGDVLVALNDLELVEKNNEAIGKISRKPGDSVTYTIRRGTELKKFPVTLTTMSQDAIASNLGHHMMEQHTTVATATTTPPDTKAATNK